MADTACSLCDGTGRSAFYSDEGQLCRRCHGTGVEPVECWQCGGVPVPGDVYCDPCGYALVAELAAL